MTASIRDTVATDSDGNIAAFSAGMPVHQAGDLLVATLTTGSGAAAVGTMAIAGWT